MVSLTAVAAAAVAQAAASGCPVTTACGRAVPRPVAGRGWVSWARDGGWPANTADSGLGGREWDLACEAARRSAGP